MASEQKFGRLPAQPSPPHWLTLILFTAVSAATVMLWWSAGTRAPEVALPASLILLCSWLQAVALLKCRQYYLIRLVRLQSLVQKLSVERENQALILDRRWQSAAVLQSLGFFAASVLHNIASPLSTLGALLSEVRPQLSNQQYRDWNASLGYIFSVVRHARQQLRQEPPESAAIPIRAVLQQTYDLIRNVATSRGVQVEIACQTDISLTGDPVLLLQILLNLTQNSLEALSSKTAGVIRLVGRRGRKSIIIEVEDNGLGMPPDQLRRLGRRRYTFKRLGCGLGLAFVRDSLRRGWKGSCHFVSRPGKGTLVKLAFPLPQPRRLRYNGR